MSRAKIHWYLDRFGLPGEHNSRWLSLLTHNRIDPICVEKYQLSRKFHEPLLTKYRNRKAPTWREDMVHRMKDFVDSRLYADKPKLIVVACPELLWMTGVDPEHATLMNLRGARYHYDCMAGRFPLLVTLPMSAWSTHVTSKDIAAANYGMTEQEQFESHFAEHDDNESDSDGDGETDRSSEDQLWYEPVIVSVGKFMLTADVKKIARYWNDKQGQIVVAPK